jgi:hypothetical protein
MSELCLLSEVKLKSDFGAVRAAFDPNPTLNRARVLPTTKLTRDVPREIL